MNFVNITNQAPIPKEVFVAIDARPKTIKITEELLRKTRAYIQAKRLYAARMRERNSRSKEVNRAKIVAVPYNSTLEKVEAQEFTQVGQVKIRLLDK